VAPTDATVLLRGESGTGKELVARALYQYSHRSKRPFLVINCVAIPETLLESELFGYEKGAFTGASHRRIGKIEQANGGTIFLDEIGDMPFSIQAKILRLLQEKSIERLGGRETIPVDVRIIAATNRNLEKAISDGQFREDLYFRLKVVTVWLPPLRERTQDIPMLLEYFLTQHARDMGVDNPFVADDAKNLLVNHPWPGNVRELANTIQKALIFNRGGPIRTEDLGHALTEREPGTEGEEGSQDAAIRQWIKKRLINPRQDDLFDRCMDQFASVLISEALNLTGGNRSKAAELLGLSRPTLHSKIEKYQLKLETMVKA
jgi:transcriptional regulator with PAS, ATPase and Fis domain